MAKGTELADSVLLLENSVVWCTAGGPGLENDVPVLPVPSLGLPPGCFCGHLSPGQLRSGCDVWLVLNCVQTSFKSLSLVASSVVPSPELSKLLLEVWGSETHHGSNSRMEQGWETGAGVLVLSLSSCLSDVIFSSRP